MHEGNEGVAPQLTPPLIDIVNHVVGQQVDEAVPIAGIERGVIALQEFMCCAAHGLGILIGRGNRQF